MSKIFLLSGKILEVHETYSELSDLLNKAIGIGDPIIEVSEVTYSDYHAHYYKRPSKRRTTLIVDKIVGYQ